MMVSKMADYVFLDLGCGYGTKPVNVLFLSFVMVFLFALAYTGLSFPNGFKPEQLIPNGINSLITSIIAFLPAGLTYWGGIAILDFTNIADCIYKVLLLAENTLGMFLFLLFTMTFFRKLLRY